MQSNWLYDQSALWIVAVLMVAMILAAELAFRVGRRWHTETHDAGRHMFIAIKAALLGLLALLLAFAFSMAADRYAERQRLVMDEANVLHTLLLYGSLLPEPAQAQFQQLFGQYVETRLEFFDARRNLTDVGLAMDRTENLHHQMWLLAQAQILTNAPPNSPPDLMNSLTDAWSIQRQRVHAFENRVPDAVILLLFFGSIIAMLAVGFAAGIANHHGIVGTVLLAALLGGTILVVLDLDRPRRGFFKLSQEPMLHLKEVFKRESGSNL